MDALEALDKAIKEDLEIKEIDLSDQYQTRKKILDPEYEEIL